MESPVAIPRKWQMKRLHFSDNTLVQCPVENCQCPVVIFGGPARVSAKTVSQITVLHVATHWITIPENIPDSLTIVPRNAEEVSHLSSPDHPLLFVTPRVPHRFRPGTT